MTTDPTFIAAHENLSEAFADLRRQLDGLDAGALNARPGGEGTNPLGVIAIHALASTRSWLAIATGTPFPPRDRPSEFTVLVDDADGFRTDVDEKIADILALVDATDAFDPTAEATPTWSANFAEPVTAAWALQHALQHLGEHLGHAHLTRELLV